MYCRNCGDTIEGNSSRFCSSCRIQRSIRYVNEPTMDIPQSPEEWALTFANGTYLYAVDTWQERYNKALFCIKEMIQKYKDNK